MQKLKNRSHRPSKRLSQSFLQDKNIARKIVDALPLGNNAFILEIGPGKGILTEFLVRKATRVMVVEIDDLLARELPDRLGQPNNLEVLCQDFLKVDLNNIFKRFDEYDKYIIGNLPYHLTSPILFKILENADEIHSTVFMVQKEVGQRITSNPGKKTYGILSVLCQVVGQVDYLFTVPPHLFFPKPKVESAVVRLIFKHPPYKGVVDPDMFRWIVKTTFKYRRKMLRNTLSELFSETILKNITIDLTRRPESLSVQEFKDLANQVYQILER